MISKITSKYFEPALITCVIHVIQNMQHETLVRNAKKNTLIMFNLSVHLMVENFPCHIAYLSIVGVVEVGVQLDTNFLVG